MTASDNPARAFGQAIRRRRRVRDLSQDVLARRAGMSGKHLGEIERGQSDPRISTVLRLVTALELSPHELTVLWDELIGDGDPWPGS